MIKLALFALIIVALFICAVACFGGEVGLPTEHLVLPEVEAVQTYQVCIWDESGRDWLQPHQTYDHSGSYDFLVPAWGRWYWIGLWDVANEEYVYGKWIGHFKTA